MTRESNIEDYFVERVKAHGGEVRKVQWIGRTGAPDRLVFLRGVFFVELKRPGKLPEDHQVREHNRMRQQGADVSVISTFEGVDDFIREITG